MNQSIRFLVEIQLAFRLVEGRNQHAHRRVGSYSVHVELLGIDNRADMPVVVHIGIFLLVEHYTYDDANEYLAGFEEDEAVA